MKNPFKNKFDIARNLKQASSVIFTISSTLMLIVRISLSGYRHFTFVVPCVSLWRYRSFRSCGTGTGRVKWTLLRGAPSPMLRNDVDTLMKKPLPIVLKSYFLRWRSDGPSSAIWCDELISLSIIASARVASAMYSYHLSNGSCEVMITDFFSYLSSSRVSRAIRVLLSIVCNPKSSSMMRSFLLSLASILSNVPSRRACFNWSTKWFMLR